MEHTTKTLNKITELARIRDKLLDELGPDLNITEQAGPGEVAVVQYLRPHGHRRLMFAPVGQAYADRAEGMFLSAEWLPTGQVAIYGRWADQPTYQEILELADNGPGPRNPTAVLQQVIDQLWAQAQAQPAPLPGGESV